MKKTVTERALMARINRKLAHEGQILKKCRADTRSYQDLGDFYLVNIYQNAVYGQHINLEGLGQELGVLQDWEELEP